MVENLWPGKNYFYIWRGEVRFGKLYKIVGLVDCIAGMFIVEGCAKESAVPAEFIFDDLDSAKESLNNV